MNALYILPSMWGIIQSMELTEGQFGSLMQALMGWACFSEKLDAMKNRMLKGLALSFAALSGSAAAGAEGDTLVINKSMAAAIRRAQLSRGETARLYRAILAYVFDGVLDLSSLGKRSVPLAILLCAIIDERVANPQAGLNLLPEAVYSWPEPPAKKEVPEPQGDAAADGEWSVSLSPGAPAEEWKEGEPAEDKERTAAAAEQGAAASQEDEPQACTSVDVQPAPAAAGSEDGGDWQLTHVPAEPAPEAGTAMADSSNVAECQTEEEEAAPEAAALPVAKREGALESRAATAQGAGNPTFDLAADLPGDSVPPGQSGPSVEVRRHGIGVRKPTTAAVPVPKGMGGSQALAALRSPDGGRKQTAVKEGCLSRPAGSVAACLRALHDMQDQTGATAEAVPTKAAAAEEAPADEAAADCILPRERGPPASGTAPETWTRRQIY